MGEKDTSGKLGFLDSLGRLFRVRPATTGAPEPAAAGSFSEPEVQLEAALSPPGREGRARSCRAPAVSAVRGPPAESAYRRSRAASIVPRH
jgi:hypothetical protein